MSLFDIFYLIVCLGLLAFATWLYIRADYDGIEEPWLISPDECGPED